MKREFVIVRFSASLILEVKNASHKIGRSNNLSCKEALPGEFWVRGS